MIQLKPELSDAIEYISENVSINVREAIILGSGLGEFADLLENKKTVFFKDIPNFPQSSVAGHHGSLVFGNLNGKDILAVQGRVHLYEGYSPEEIIFPIQVYHGLGIKNLILTNAAGCTNTNFSEGDLMLISDQINFTFKNPLTGKNNDQLGPRFPDMSMPYSKELIILAEKAASENNILLKKGVYFGLQGPSYETPAEIRMIQFFGGDAVGMSTIHDLIAAKYLGMNVLGISCLTNMGAGLAKKTLTHDDVTKTAHQVKNQFVKLISSIIKSI
jgi:purine-nucleoside phosphorylase